ncbi:GxxExxY protein [Gelidibacter algens]|jgi:GxxExxY protein|uniref:GxxExxY protein n=2 Tax=Gelidibacter algens TaxID=49280 RepID=A0A327S6W5_9FLAO|nr:GxxExxY protein [Gelidibacter algens]
MAQIYAEEHPIKSAVIREICGKKSEICGKKIKSKIMEQKTENDISYLIRGAIFKIYNELGPGLLESVYETVLSFELRKQGLEVKNQVPLPVFYEGTKLELGFRLDLLVNEKVVVEIKSVENLAEVHHKQVLTYLKLSNLKLGILVNFNVDNIEKGIFRKVNGL